MNIEKVRAQRNFKLSFLLLFGLGLGATPARLSHGSALRDHSLEDHMGYQGSNAGWLHARQVPCQLYYIGPQVYFQFYLQSRTGK